MWYIYQVSYLDKVWIVNIDCQQNCILLPRHFWWWVGLSFLLHCFELPFTFCTPSIVVISMHFFFSGSFNCQMVAHQIEKKKCYINMITRFEGATIKKLCTQSHNVKADFWKIGWSISRIMIILAYQQCSQQVLMNFATRIFLKVFFRKGLRKHFCKQYSTTSILRGKQQKWSRVVVSLHNA